MSYQRQQRSQGPLPTQRPITAAALYRASLMKAPQMRPVSTATEIFDGDSDAEGEDDEIDDGEDGEIVNDGGYFGLEEAEVDRLHRKSDNSHGKWDWEHGRPVALGDAGVDEDEDDSEFEEDLFAGDGKRSFESEDSRRRSQTTLSSYDEISTPDRGWASKPFIVVSKSVEGPRGPHLFRSSQSSAEMAFDHALQMSPLIPIKLDLGPEHAPQQLHNTIDITDSSKELNLSDDINDEDAHSIIRRWSPRDVTDWMTSWDMDPSVVRSFEKHDINGAVLLELQYEHLRELDIESFGKRHQLWSAICILRGDDEPTLQPEVSRPSTRNAASRTSSYNSHDVASSSSESEDVEPAPEKQPVLEPKNRRGRKKPTVHDTIHPGESISIVAIEQLLPKLHNCAKGENCTKRQKQQSQIRLLQEANAIGRFPVIKDDTKAVEAAAIPRSPSAPPSSLRVPGRQTLSALPSPSNFIHTSEPGTPMRPTSEVVPSVVASSDLLGPGQLPAFNIQTNLHPDMLDKLDSRDPQDNVRNFLNFQHMNSPITPLPLTPLADQNPGYQVPRSHSVATVHQMFPTQHHQAYPSLAANPNFLRSKTPGPGGLKDLPKLNIPSSPVAAAGANHHLNNSLASPRDRNSISRNMTASPPTQIYRLGTPASEMDVPVTAIPAGPIARDVSQSVPPNMQFRQPTQQQSPRARPNHASTDWRRPSLLHTVKEGEVFPAAAAKQNQPRPSISTTHSSKESTSTLNSSSTSTWTTSPEKKASDPAHSSPVTRQFGYGASCTHAGWMKKRRTKMLRHEWQEAHFRLTGSQLNMHDSARLTAALKESINVDDYAVACSTLPSNSKLSAAMRSAFNHLNNNSANVQEGTGNGGAAKDVDPTAFAFQLIPERQTGGAAAVARKLHAPTLAKTHHFAVTSKDERIDWMREIMLTKALQARGRGYEVEVNGVQQD